ncbi:hypothetical protein FRC00_003135, partial [Tulasnella sp. 408]
WKATAACGDLRLTRRVDGVTVLAAPSPNVAVAVVVDVEETPALKKELLISEDEVLASEADENS